MNTKLSADRFLTVFTLMSRIPVKRAFDADFSLADFWIPAISPIVSLSAIVGFAAGMALSGSLAIAAAASIAVQYFCFNLFHFDGLVDTADAMLPAAAPDRRLEILKDPRVGTYGFFCGALALGLRAGAIVLLAEGGVLFSALVAGFITAPAAGRLACALVPASIKPAKPTGLGALMGSFSKKHVAAGTALALLPGLAWSAATGGWLLPLLTIASALASGFGAALFVSKTYSAKVGGFTGDALGAAVELGEIAALLLLGIAVRLSGWIPA
jgi:adenosylcobinamide-GDP ribazoletransferase